jgi:hypothetical protein
MTPYTVHRYPVIIEHRQGYTMNELPDFPKQPIAPNMRYEFRINGRLSLDIANWFEGMTLSVDETTTPVQTIIQSVIRDQAALYGLISRIRDLGLTLLSVNLVEEKENES